MTKKRSLIQNIIVSMRPKQWTKNLFIFATLLFSKNLFNLSLLLTTILAFVIFCLLSGGVYLINDIVDLERDKNHPRKTKRPLAAGQLGISSSIIAAVLLILISLTVSFLINLYFGLVALSYFLLMTAYTLVLKEIVIIDVLTISFGFVLRVVAGALIIAVEVSPWLLICTILLALFLALAKRRHELILLEDAASVHRRILREYTSKLLDEMMAVVTASTLMAYILYTISSRTIEELHTKNLIFTTPFVIYGIFRYLYLIHQKGLGGNPEDILLKDKPLIVNIFLWILTVIIILYLAP